MRNIRRRNEQSYLQPIPRGYNLTRVSLAAQLGGLDLPQRRDLKVTPFAAARYLRDNRFAVDPSDTSGDVGLDVKWGITPKLTADVTVNTDFAQVEADDEQVNLTRSRIPLAAWAASRWGSVGIWWVISLTAIARALAMIWLWRSGGWKRKSV